MKIKPMNDRILVSRLKPQEKTEGGIYLPTSSQEKPNEGVVKAVGPGRLSSEGGFIPLDVSVGDHVTYAGSEIVVEREEFVILREEDILGIFIKEKSAGKPGKTLKAKK